MADCGKTEVFLSEWNRMCVFYQNCIKCDAHEIGCDAEDGMCERTPKLKDIVQKWSDAHPLPKPKTYADDFFEKYPNAKRHENGRPFVCRCDVYGCECNYKKSPEVIYWRGKQGFDDCLTCWNEPYMEEETNG